jgi:hypothetical protein
MEDATAVAAFKSASDLLWPTFIFAADVVFTVSAILLFCTHLLGITLLPRITRDLNNLLGIGNE